MNLSSFGWSTFGSLVRFLQEPQRPLGAVGLTMVPSKHNLILSSLSVPQCQLLKWRALVFMGPESERASSCAVACLPYLADSGSGHSALLSLVQHFCEC